MLFIFSCTKSIGDSSPDGRGDFALSAGSSGGGGGNNNGGGTAGVITAGEWNDATNWDFWKSLLQRDTIKTFPALWGFYTENRISILLRDAQGRLVHDAKLTLTGASSYSAVTDNYGQAELYPGLFTAGYSPVSYGLKAEYHGQTFDLGTVPAGTTTLEKSLPIVKTVVKTVDVAFVVDATGSMGDEISYLKTELRDVINRAGAQLPGTQLRMSSVFYRDRGDDYVVRPFNFTTSASQLSSFINNQDAGGGGDFPEAVDEGLDEAVNRLSWSSAAINRIIFLILDAPAHQTDEVRSRLKQVIATAQQKGIRIIPVSASGINRETEFFLRFLALSTNGTYVFITNDSGVGAPHLQPTVGAYQVEFLNNLMVRLITKYGLDR
jgi:hypothetical protein